MRDSDQKNLYDWFKAQRLYDDNYQRIEGGWRKRHEIPQGNTEYGFFVPRMMDKTIRDLVKLGYLEGQKVAGKNLKEWRAIPHEEQTRAVDLSDPRQLSQLSL